MTLRTSSRMQMGQMLDYRARRGSRGIARVRRPCRFDEQHVRLLLRSRTVFHAAGYHEEFSFAEDDISFTHLDGEPALQHKKEIVRIVVLVPRERALDLDDHEIVAIELANRLRPIVFGERGQFLREIYALH